MGGVLLVLDLYEAKGLSERMLGVARFPAHIVLNLLHTGHIREPREVRDAWDAHGRNDRYLTLAQVRGICNRALPGAIVRQHLLWRYSIVWRKPTG